MTEPVKKDEIEIDGETFTLDFGTNMQIRVEEADVNERAYYEILQAFLEHPTARMARLIVKASMLPTENGPAVTDEQAGICVDHAFGGYRAFADLIKNSPKPKDVKAAA